MVKFNEAAENRNKVTKQEIIMPINTLCSNYEEVKEKLLVILFSYAIIYPFTMMIKIINTSLK